MTAAGSWQEALLDAAVMAPRERPRARSVLALLARFAAGQGIAASPQWLLDYDVVEAFCVRGCAGRASSTRGTCRSALYQLAAPVHGAAGHRATPFAGARAPAPYSAGERAELAAVAAGRSVMRPNVLRRWRWWYSGSGRDCGPASWRRCAAATSHSRGRQVMVHVSGGAGSPGGAGRRALCRAGAELGGGADGGFVFRPGPADRAIRISSPASPGAW